MLSAAHLHILLNHWPIIATMLAMVLAAIAVLRPNEAVARVALSLMALGGLASLPTYLSGQRAEDAVERLPDVTEALVERHQESALQAAIVVGIVGAFALWALWRYRRDERLPRWVATTALVGAVIGSALMGYAGLLGGRIRHTEVRPGYVPPAAEAGVK